MNKLAYVILFFVSILCAQFTLAADLQSYQKLLSQSSLDTKLNSPAITNENLSPKQIDNLIQQNMDQRWQKNPPKYELNTTTPYNPKNYMGGTGTRGGGSGLIVQSSETFIEVKLLEIFRSENLARYNLFFPIDPELKKLENNLSTDLATQTIFETVLNRITQVAPNLGVKISNLYRADLPFSNWIPIFHDLPLIDDEIAHPQEQNNDKVQIAYRRTNYIAYNTRAYNAMTPLNRAALWLHEYIYALSGVEQSIKIQRTVSLFFSSEFLKIAADQTKLTQLFFDLDLLAISRKSLAGSLPPGAAVTDQKQIENCGTLISIKGSPAADTVELIVSLPGQMTMQNLNRSQASVILGSLMWSKMFLEKSYPLYKFYGQKIMADKVCFNSKRNKITQIQSALAIDEDMAKATRNAAEAEIEFFKAKSTLIELKEKYHINPAEINPADLVLASAKMRTTEAVLRRDEFNFQIQAISSMDKIINPKILGEYSITIDN